MTRIIAVASGKGGVGKTTLVSNLSAALAHFGKSVVAVDANITTSNLGIHLGIPLYPVTIQDVLNGRAHLRDAVYNHKSGFRVVPADISLRKTTKLSPHNLMDTLYKFAGNSDFVLIDTAAGIGKEARMSIEAADEMLTVTNPEMPALTDALKLSRVAEQAGTKNIGAVLNRVRGDAHEVSQERAENFLGFPIIANIPEDHAVRKSIHQKVPAVTMHPDAAASHEFKRLAALLSGETYTPKNAAFSFARFFSWLK
jgi:septum site-determining protein MinD